MQIGIGMAGAGAQGPGAGSRPAWPGGLTAAMPSPASPPAYAPIPPMPRPPESFGGETEPADEALAAPEPAPAVLVVDDNVRLARTVASFMEMEGFRTQTAYSAEMALQAVERAAFDLALIDINMPGMDGIEVCRRLLAMSPGVRVLIFTGREAGDDPQRAAAAGARRLLIKPMSLAALRDEMRKALAS
jgi:CheY-like chemotaxis protein